MSTATQKSFQEMTPEEQEDQNHKDLREIKDYYGSWDDVRKLIDMLEDNDNEAAYERFCTRY